MKRIKYQNVSLRVKLRRWWKSYKECRKWEGYIRPILKELPFSIYYRISNLYWSIRHRTTDIYHKVDSGLKPGYYDIDTLILNTNFSLLCRFVEKEYKGPLDVLKRITDLIEWSKDTSNVLPEHVEENKKAHIKQAMELVEVLRLYYWWKIDYPKYEENDPYHIYCKNNPDNIDLNDRMEIYKTDEDGDPVLYQYKPNNNPEFKKAMEEGWAYEKKCEEEITNNLIKLITLRKSLWT